MVGDTMPEMSALEREIAEERRRRERERFVRPSPRKRETETKSAAMPAQCGEEWNEWARAHLDEERASIFDTLAHVFAEERRLRDEYVELACTRFG
jgi:hypothetical protein